MSSFLYQEYGWNENDTIIFIMISESGAKDCNQEIIYACIKCNILYLLNKLLF